MAVWQLLVLFGVGAAAGFMNVMAAGGSLLTLPVLIFMGLDGALANGTNRIAIAAESAAAVLGFRRQALHNFHTSVRLSVAAVPGAVLGAALAVRISDLWFQRVLAVVMVTSALALFLPLGGRRLEDEALSPARRRLAYPAMFGVGLYGGFLQAGVGLVFMAVLYRLLRMSLVHVNMHKVFITFFYTLPALGVFLWTGNVAWAPGLTLAAGMAAGAWLATHAAVRGGERAVRAVLVLVLLLMSARLVGGA